MAEQPAIKTFSFGGCDFGRTSPGLDRLSPETKVLNIEIGFEEALKLHVAIDECIRRSRPSVNRFRAEGPGL